MSDVTVRSDSVDVEQIMKQIRTRIREKRGSDYTQQELQQLASVKLEQFADPSGLRSDLLDQFRQRSSEPSTYHRHRGPRRWLLMAMHPVLKRVQKQLMADLNLYFEIIHNLVIETTRLGIENTNLKMKVEALSSRVEFDERRARALEGVVQYRQDALPRHRPSEPPRSADTVPSQPAYGAPPAATAPAPQGGTPSSSPSQPFGGRSGDPNRPDGERRRRRRRRRRRPGPSMGDRPPMAGAPAGDTAPPVGDGFDAGDADGPDEDDGAPDQ